MKYTVSTSFGNFTLSLFPEDAPATVKNFSTYVEENFYNSTIFHRVIDGFMIQGGGFDKNLEEKSTKEPIQNEANNGLSNKALTIAMARTSEPHSASSQFFINLVDNTFLDFNEETSDGWGYAVFGEVIEGQETIFKIGKVQTGTRGFFQDVPVKPIEIQKITKLK